jgi:hypothetical protein
MKETDAYLLDTGFHVHVWIGKKASGNVRTLAVLHAETYFNSWKRPVMPVTILKQGQETDAFAQYFIDGGGGACVVMKSSRASLSREYLSGGTVVGCRIEPPSRSEDPREAMDRIME